MVNVFIGQLHLKSDGAKNEVVQSVRTTVCSQRQITCSERTLINRLAALTAHSQYQRNHSEKLAA